MKLALILATGMAGALWAAGPASAKSLDNKVIWNLSQADSIAIISDGGGRIDGVSATEDGFVLKATFPGDMPVLFTGMDCKGKGQAMRCPEYEVLIDFRAKSAAAAQQFDRERQVEFVADGSDGDIYKIWKMSFLYGGVTRTHVLNEIIEVVHIGWQVSAIFPYKGPGWKPKGQRPKDSALLHP